jgi:hypothetical protein
MARALAKTMALPRRLSLGRQRQGLHLPRRRAKEGRWPNAGVSNEITTASPAKGHSLDISALAKPQLAALFGRFGCATRSEPLARGIRRIVSASNLAVRAESTEYWRNCAKGDCTASLSVSRWCMRRKQNKKELSDATRASVKKEMAKPRMAKSARITVLRSARTRVPK